MKTLRVVGLTVLALCAAGCVTADYSGAIRKLRHASLNPFVSQNQRAWARELEDKLRVVSAGGNIDVRDDEDGYTLLMGVITYGDLDLAALLLRNGADVNAVCKVGWTPLMMAAANGHLDALDFLVSNGAAVNVKEQDGNTALILAAGGDGDSAATVRLLLERGADVNAKNEYGETALITAADRNRLKTMEVLIKHGADVNARAYREDMTVLMMSGLEGKKLLVKNGADVNAKDADGFTAFMRVAWDDTERMDHLKLLLPKVKDINDQAERGETALYWAAKGGNLDATRFLIEHGADANLRTKAGETALGVAVKEQHAKVVTFLKVHGAIE